MDDVVVVNENDEVIGTMPKAQAHNDGTPHRISVVYVENDLGQILVQLRKDRHLDHSAADHVDPGESYEDAARRELAEELGITDAELTKIGHAQTRNERYGDRISTHVFDIFLCKAAPGALQEAEVQSVYWADPAEVLADMSRNEPDKYCEGFKASLPVYLSSRRP